MQQRACDFCGGMYTPKTERSRFCTDNHRAENGKYKRAGKPVPAATRHAQSQAPKPERNTQIADRLTRELTELGVFDQYEAAVVVGLARQLDSGVVTGAAYVSLSKEVDRRVDALRLKAVRPDDPVRQILTAVEDKQAHLRAV